MAEGHSTPEGWTTEEASRFFETGGAERPSPPAAPAAPAASSLALRWVVDISLWDPSPAEWELLLTILTEEERTKTMRFKFVADQKRAIVSRLLQRAACHARRGSRLAQLYSGRRPPSCR